MMNMQTRNSVVIDKRDSLATSLSLYQAYTDMFDIVRADTPALLEQVYKLRYQIYCVENPFEDPKNNLSGLEMDAYDSHSVHYLLIHRASETAVGTVRMVLPLAEKLLHSFPIQSVCDIENLKNPGHIQGTSEISRFCISKMMRRRIEDEGIHSGVFRPDAPIDGAGAEASKRRVIYHAALGLIRACIEIMQERGIDSSYLICEPTLLRILGKLGVCSTPIGPLVEYHGQRQPVVVSHAKVLENTLQNHFDIWQILSDDGRLHPHGKK